MLYSILTCNALVSKIYFSSSKFIQIRIAVLETKLQLNYLYMDLFHSMTHTWHQKSNGNHNNCFHYTKMESLQQSTLKYKTTKFHKRQ